MSATGADLLLGLPVVVAAAVASQHGLDTAAARAARPLVINGKVGEREWQLDHTLFVKVTGVF